MTMAALSSPFSVGSTAKARRLPHHQASTHCSNGAKQRLTSSSVRQGRARSLPSYNHSRRYCPSAVPVAPPGKGGGNGVLAGAASEDGSANPQRQTSRLWRGEVRQMRFNRFLHLIAFSGKAHRRSPAFGRVSQPRLPDTNAPSQAKSTPDFGPYIPLSGIEYGGGDFVEARGAAGRGDSAARISAEQRNRLKSPDIPLFRPSELRAILNPARREIHPIDQVPAFTATPVSNQAANGPCGRLPPAAVTGVVSLGHRGPPQPAMLLAWAMRAKKP